MLSFKLIFFELFPVISFSTRKLPLALFFRQGDAAAIWLGAQNTKVLFLK
jgi:hypothetical protein